MAVSLERTEYHGLFQIPPPERTPRRVSPFESAIDYSNPERKSYMRVFDEVNVSRVTQLRATYAPPGFPRFCGNVPDNDDLRLAQYRQDPEAFRVQSTAFNAHGVRLPHHFSVYVREI